MTRRRRKGFSIVLALLAVSLAGMAMAMLAAASGNLAFSSRRAYIEACDRNLRASALAWTRRRPAAAGDTPKNEKIELNTAALEIPNARLSVTRLPEKNGQPRWKITTHCRRKRMAIRTERIHRLGADRPAVVPASSTSQPQSRPAEQ